jgi:hypothetical protein
MTITVGTPFTIDAGSGGNGIKSAQLSSTKIIVGYIDGDNSNRPSAVIVENDPLIVALSSVKALMFWRSSGGNSNFRVLNISGTTITAPGAILTATFTTSATIQSAFVNLTSANSLFIYTAGITDNAVVMSVSGNTVTEESGGAISSWASGIYGLIGATALSSTKVLACYDPGVPHPGVATILNVSGVTVSDGGVDTTFEAGHTNAIDVCALSSSAAIVTYSDNGDSDRGKAQIITVSGNTPTANTPLTYQTNTVTETAVAAFNANNAAVISNGPDQITELTISGTTITKGDESGVTITSDVWATAYDASLILMTYDGSVKGVMVTLGGGALSLVTMTKAADIDAAGEFIYVALLEGGTPILTKISTALNADGTTVFNPGAGTNIGVECGRFSSDTVWVAGNFDGTNVVEKSEDSGTTFTAKDDGTIGDVRTFVMGPDSDERILVFDETNGDILETINDGATWTAINAAVTPEVNAIARFGKNVQEAVFGNDGGANNSINYTVNSGADLEDFQTGVYPNANATRVIVN